mgnify:CR=1 FL=1
MSKLDVCEMKILFCTYTGVDYGLDNLYDGLCRVLGYENIYEYPTKVTLHSGPIRRFISACTPAFFNYPVIADDETKIKMLKNNEFDMICVSTRAITNELLIKKSKTIPTFIIDQDDTPGINAELFKQFNARLYFKREYLTAKKYEKWVTPLNFSYSEKYAPNINVERQNFLFYVGRGYQGRWKFIEALQKTVTLSSVINMTGGSIRVYTQPEYSEQLLHSKIGLNLRGYGYDSGRYYETPAHGALLFSLKFPLVVEHPFTEGDNAVFFENIDEMVHKLVYLTKHPKLVRDLSIKGYEHFLKYHTTQARAQQMLEKIL